MRQHISDATLRELSGYRLQRATGIAMLGYKKVFAKFGLRRTTFSCLSLIVDNPGLRQSQLAEALAIERPNLVKVVEDMVGQGWIARETSADDKRAYALTPTAKGRALLGDALAAVQEFDRKVSNGLSRDEVKALHNALSKIEANSNDASRA